jgi:hypothetical protein
MIMAIPTILTVFKRVLLEGGGLGDVDLVGDPRGAVCALPHTSLATGRSAAQV